MAGAERRRPYKQVARAQAQERTRETLLQAATEEIEKDGWKQASLESVAERAGVTKQTALRHFGSKEGLFDAVLRRTSSIVVKERAEAPIGDIPGAVANLMRHYERYGDVVTRLLPYRDAVVRVLGPNHRGSLARRAVDRGHEVHEEWVLSTFEPLLERVDEQTRQRRLAQLVAVCDVYMWKILRRDLNLSLTSAEAALVELIERLVEPDAPRPKRKSRSKPPSRAQPSVKDTR
ncbi:MAG TPA: TetR/AcrR family transcriptional regulator [Solirubrobacteraceae bacterium]|jgi:AcrR family transcriptional regulator|nr:TetR/AcrR family transcriptional regulator [Solirubrobacteraceae bacterium]